MSAQPDLFTVARARASDPVTSKDAACRVSRVAQHQADMIRDALRQLGPRGATYKELDDRFGWPHPTAARRLAAIVQAGDALHLNGNKKKGMPLVKRDGCAIYVATGWAVMAAHRAGKEAA